MKKFPLSPLIVFFVAALFFSITPASAQEQPRSIAPQQIILLKDGSSIKGQLTGVNSTNGAYIIQTPTLGQITVDAANVVSISSADLPPPPSPVDQTQADLSRLQNLPQVKSMRDTLLADPKMFSQVQTLADDPEMTAILQDPEFLKTLLSMDPAVIQSNPKFQKLLQHPAMQSLMQGMQEKMPAGNFLPNQK